MCLCGSYLCASSTEMNSEFQRAQICMEKTERSLIMFLGEGIGYGKSLYKERAPQTSVSLGVLEKVSDI